MGRNKYARHMTFSRSSGDESKQARYTCDITRGSMGREIDLRTRT